MEADVCGEAAELLHAHALGTVGPIFWLALTTVEKIGLASASAALFAVGLGIINLWLSARNERRRAQPIVIAHEARGRHFAKVGTAWAVDAYMTSEGAGPAFNVRFGVVFHGVRYPFKMRPEDPDAGNLQPVLRQGERRPKEDAWPVMVDSSRVFAGKGNPDPTRVYWTRYENAQGQTWETLSPGDRSARLNIRRVRSVRFREWREERARQRAGKQGREIERQILRELLEGMKDPPDSDPPG